MVQPIPASYPTRAVIYCPEKVDNTSGCDDLAPYAYEVCNMEFNIGIERYPDEKMYTKDLIAWWSMKVAEKSGGNLVNTIIRNSFSPIQKMRVMFA